MIDIKRKRNNEQVHIGDGVYISYDGYQIWLFLQNGNTIAIEPEVFSYLIKYVKVIPEFKSILDYEMQNDPPST